MEQISKIRRLLDEYNADDIHPDDQDGIANTLVLFVGDLCDEVERLRTVARGAAQQLHESKTPSFTSVQVKNVLMEAIEESTPWS